MKLRDIEPHYREALAVQSIFMGFGIPPDDIYVNYSPPKFQALARQGELQYAVDVAELEISCEQYTKEWTEVVKAWNAAPKKEREALTNATEARRDAVQIIFGMIAKGMRSRSMLAEMH